MINPRFRKTGRLKKKVKNNSKNPVYVRQLKKQPRSSYSRQSLMLVKEAIIDDWIATQEQYEKDDRRWFITCLW